MKHSQPAKKGVDELLVAQRPSIRWKTSITSQSERFALFVLTSSVSSDKIRITSFNDVYLRVDDNSPTYCETLSTSFKANIPLHRQYLQINSRASSYSLRVLLTLMRFRSYFKKSNLALIEKQNFSFINNFWATTRHLSDGVYRASTHFSLPTNVIFSHS